MAVVAAISRRRNSVSPPGSDRPLCDRFRVLGGKLLIEIDGGQHNEAAGLSRDAERTNWLDRQGFEVMRFWNNDVMRNGAGCQQVIAEAISRRRKLSFE